MDKRQHDDVSPAGPNNPDEGDEYELEPPDPDVMAGVQHRAQQAIEQTKASIAIDEIYREVERDRGREIVESWFRGTRFRFQVKHLLVATAVLAILLTLAKLDLMIFVVIGVMLSIAGVYLYFQWLDKQQQDEADRRRQEMYARRRTQLAAKSPAAAADAAATAKANEPVEPLPPLPNEVDEIWQAAQEMQRFQFRFSMFQLLMAITIAAVFLGLAYALGGPSQAAALLGLVALFGLVIHALGFEPSEVVVLGWWLILVMYVILGVVGAMLSTVT